MFRHCECWSVECRPYFHPKYRLRAKCAPNRWDLPNIRTLLPGRNWIFNRAQWQWVSHKYTHIHTQAAFPTSEQWRKIIASTHTSEVAAHRPQAADERQRVRWRHTDHSAHGTVNHSLRDAFDDCILQSEHHLVIMHHVFGQNCTH